MSSSRDIAQGKFNGRGWEFFKIYYINILLTFLTLGLYTPWARVRSKRYLLGHTHIGPHRFDYHANPLRMFKALLILYVVIGGYALMHIFVLQRILMESADVAKFISYAHFVLIILLPPWIINRVLSFNAQMTSFANIRFKYQASYRATFSILYFLPFLSFFTAGLAYPYTLKIFKEYFVNKHVWGEFPLDSCMRAGKIYKTFLYAILVPFIFLIFTWLQITPIHHLDNLFVALLNPLYLACTLIILISIPAGYLHFYYFLRIELLHNLRFFSIGSDQAITQELIQQHRPSGPTDYVETNQHTVYMRTSQSCFKTTGKAALNIFLSILTVGFYIPFAIINMRKYAVECLSLEGNIELISENKDPFKEKGSYLSEGYSDIGNVELPI